MLLKLWSYCHTTCGHWQKSNFCLQVVNCSSKWTLSWGKCKRRNQKDHCPLRNDSLWRKYLILSEKRHHWVSDQTCALESCSKNQRKNGPWNRGKIKNENPSGFEHLPLLFHSFPPAPTLWNTQFQMLSILFETFYHVGFEEDRYLSNDFHLIYLM